MPRTKTRFSLTRFIAVLLSAALASAQSPQATIQDVAWLEGHWQGTALGGTADEYWSSPMAGSMMGMFRLVKDDKVTFYELFRIAEENGSLVLRLKHFHPDMKGWEEKDATVTFPLLKISKDEVWFDGMTFKRTGPDSVDVIVLIGKKGAPPREVKFGYRRAK
ncbi:MAG TPA: DUF6265 family protein [Bryobacteraceae bacterium]|nr:DUF6265 family protein [Bryobacteraceae bacterium]